MLDYANPVSFPPASTRFHDGISKTKSARDLPFISLATISPLRCLACSRTECEFPIGPLERSNVESQRTDGDMTGKIAIGRQKRPAGLAMVVHREWQPSFSRYCQCVFETTDLNVLLSRSKAFTPSPQLPTSSSSFPSRLLTRSRSSAFDSSTSGTHIFFSNAF